MNQHTQLLRVVVASPSDVSAEREIVPLVIEEINRSIGTDRGVRLEVIRWEIDAHPGFHLDGPQGLINPILRIEDSDLLIGIFWKRFGTPTNDASSGTEDEIRHALESWTKHGRPQVFIYFNEKSATPQSPQEATQWAQVLHFRETFPTQGLCSSYEGTSNFERLLRLHLTNYLRNQFPPKFPEGREADNTKASSDYFAVQKQLVDEHARNYVGRDDARDVVELFLRSHPCGYIFVHGGPGVGKTSFCSDLIRKYGYPHHLAGISGGRSDVRLILRSLLAQIAVSIQPVPEIPDSLPALSKLWEEVISIRGQKERIVIILDGLDELPDENLDDLRLLLPERMQEGLFLIVALRAGRLLDVLKDQTGAVPHMEYELQPLDTGHLERLISDEIPTATPAVVDQIKVASLGNPLYVRSLITELKLNPYFDLTDLPPTLEGFFRRVTRFVSGTEGERAKSILGLLSVARTPLSLSQMKHITGLPQREIYEAVVHLFRPFLIEAGGTFRFYHRSFLEFVVSKLLFPEEVINAHAMIAEWLRGSPREDTEYRWQFIAHHLLESGNYKGLEQEISVPFLAEKSRRYGYAVLDDIECVIKAMLLTGHPSAVERCVNLVEDLRTTVGESLIREATRAFRRSPSPSHTSERTFLHHQTPAIAGLDLYVTSTAAEDVSADFYEIVPTKTGCLVSIGDAPGRGLKSAFVGRFIGHLFQRSAKSENRPKSLLEDINVSLSTFDYFEQVTMQCVSLNLEESIFTMSNAGHPALAHFSKRRHKCDPLWVPGEPLHDSLRQTRRLSEYENYLAELDAGDILVLLTDGLLEYHRLDGNSYGYKFTQVIERMAECSARDVGEAIISDWRAHSVDDEYQDDAMLVVIVVRNRSTTQRDL